LQVAQNFYPFSVIEATIGEAFMAFTALTLNLDPFSGVPAVTIAGCAIAAYSEKTGFGLTAREGLSLPESALEDRTPPSFMAVMAANHLKSIN